MSTRRFFIRPAGVNCGVGDAKSPHHSIVLILAAARSEALSIDVELPRCDVGGTVVSSRSRLSLVQEKDDHAVPPLC